VDRPRGLAVNAELPRISVWRLSVDQQARNLSLAGEHQAKDRFSRLGHLHDALAAGS